MWRTVRVFMLIVVSTKVHRNTAQHQMCRDEYIIGANTEAGGQAVVYFGVARKAETRVAIKTFKEDCYYAVEHTILLTLTEKQNNDGGDTWFPKLYPSCLMSGRTCPSIVMEFVQKPFDLSQSTLLRERVDIIYQLLWAVARLHDMGYSHNDLKEGNIRITDTGAVKLIDFGLARNISKPFGSKTMEGTDIYRPPETIRRIIELSHNNGATPDYNEPLSPIDTSRLDSWPLGILSFRIFTHTNIYDRDGLIEMKKCISTISSRNRSIPRNLQSTLIRFAQYFYVKEILMGHTSRSVEEIKLVEKYPIIEDCRDFHKVCTVENRFTSQLLSRFTDTEQSREYLEKDIVDLWKVVNSLLQFENSARSNVHDTLENPIFESFIDRAVIQQRKCLLKQNSICALT